MGLRIVRREKLIFRRRKVQTIASNGFKDPTHYSFIEFGVVLPADKILAN